MTNHTAKNKRRVTEGLRDIKIKFTPRYKIITPYGDWYITSKCGYVLECNNGLKLYQASETVLREWQIVGIHKILPFNRLGKLIPISEAVKLETYSFKNGKPMYTIADIDHSTKRIHGNWNVHGVRDIYKI